MTVSWSGEPVNNVEIIAALSTSLSSENFISINDRSTRDKALFITWSRKFVDSEYDEYQYQNHLNMLNSVTFGEYRDEEVHYGISGEYHQTYLVDQWPSDTYFHISNIFHQNYQYLQGVVTAWKNFENRARAAGFDPPDNPFVALAAYSNSSVQVSGLTPDNIVTNFKAYYNLYKAFLAGAVNFDKQMINAAQLEHVTLSFAALGGTGNAYNDILKFMPNSSAQAVQAAKDAFGQINFSSVVPKVICSMEYIVDGNNQGTIIVWEHAAGSTGYIIKRRSTFSGQEDIIKLTDDEVKTSTSDMLSYIKNYATSFLGGIGDSVIRAYLDTKIIHDEVFTYTIMAYQNEIKVENIFDVETTNVMFSDDNANTIYTKMRELLGWNSSTITGWLEDRSNARMVPIRTVEVKDENLSAWPAISSFLYGDVKYDWLLAAINTKKATRRAQPNDVIRKYSYFTADSSFLIQQSKVGNLLKPSNMEKVIEFFRDVVKNSSVQKLLMQILLDTGAIDRFGNSSVQVYSGNGTFTAAGTEQYDIPLIRCIINSIDTTNLTVDANTLVTNMIALMSTQSTQLGTSPQFINSQPGSTSDVLTSKINELGSSVIDLTTLDGISRLVMMLRLISDYGPGSTITQQPAEPAEPVYQPEVYYQVENPPVDSPG